MLSVDLDLVGMDVADAGSKWTGLVLRSRIGIVKQTINSKGTSPL